MSPSTTRRVSIGHNGVVRLRRKATRWRCGSDAYGGLIIRDPRTGGHSDYFGSTSEARGWLEALSDEELLS